MTDEQIRIAIAEACGVSPSTECPECYGTGYGGSECDHIPCDRCNKTGKVEPHFDSADYPNDLNAMHEAVKSLSFGDDDSGQGAAYQECLALAVGVASPLCEVGNDVVYLHRMTEATARQRAEAFLRTLGKWVES